MNRAAPPGMRAASRRDFFRQGLVAAAGIGALGAAGCAHRPPALSSRSSRRADVLNGIDVLVEQQFAPLKGLRLGLVTNHTGQDRHRRATIDLLHEAPGVRLTALFGPEHGIRGEFDEKVRDTTDAKTGLPVYSLYGERRVPTPGQLRGLDALVFDIQDIGCRFYTYPSTMALCLQAAAEARLKFFVLDRVNPINGVAIEGPVHHGERRFIAFHHVPLRHGMTVGELARLFNFQEKLNADLAVVRVEGWRRSEWLDQTGLPWTNPSPNMKSLPAATLYSGLGLHEAALSVGRGTDRPFELVGAPYIDDLRFVAELRRAGLPGIGVLPIRFTPTYSTFKDKPCAGAAFVVTDRDQLNAVDLGLTIALILQRLWPGEFALSKVNTLLQHGAVIDAIRQGKGLPEIKRLWSDDLARFRDLRKPFLLY